MSIKVAVTFWALIILSNLWSAKSRNNPVAVLLSLVFAIMATTILIVSYVN